MALTRTDWMVLGGAVCVALVMPIALLTPRGDAPMAPPAPERSIVVPPVPALVAAYERALFAPAEAGLAAPVDAPALVGIAGRLNRDAVAMVRLANGGARSLSVGESVDGWRLESLAIDAAFFSRGQERVRVGMDQPADAPTDQ